ncbi:hypothetical protein [Symbioplanes lichenis]|uniref:hypothetical protein n=1 Tax=Symbioplanes lichenis TaxID=1629072 RepID=UPI002738F09F|nr:hypothetical protein [Actinoplanes lichenis]
MRETDAIAVHRGSWDELPADVAAMVAPPVTVSTFPATEPVDPRRRAREARLRKNMPSASGYARRRSI